MPPWITNPSKPSWPCGRPSTAPRPRRRPAEPSPPKPGPRTRAPVEAVLAVGAAVDGCPSAATAGETLTGETGSANAGQTATLSIYGPCTEGVEVDLWKLTGAGQGGPGGR